MFKAWLYNILVASSRFVSVILGGHPNESISDRLGECQIAVPSKQPFKALRIFVDTMMYMIAGETNHCLNSVSGEPKSKELWKWDK